MTGFDVVAHVRGSPRMFRVRTWGTKRSLEECGVPGEVARTKKPRLRWVATRDGVIVQWGTVGEGVHSLAARTFNRPFGGGYAVHREILSVVELGVQLERVRNGQLPDMALRHVPKRRKPGHDGI